MRLNIFFFFLDFFFHKIPIQIYSFWSISLFSCWFRGVSCGYDIWQVLFPTLWMIFSLFVVPFVEKKFLKFMMWNLFFFYAEWFVSLDKENCPCPEVTSICSSTSSEMFLAWRFPLRHSVYLELIFPYAVK